MFVEIIWRMVHDDIFVVILLALWSVVALAIICERIYSLWNIQSKTEAFKERVLAAINRGELAAASALCEASQCPLAEVYEKALDAHQHTPETVAEVVALRRADVVQRFKRYLWLLGSVGASAPFVGLFGTVIGVVRSFHSMAQTGQGGFRVVASGISEALGATALGLLVAIYAVIAYNYFVARVNRLALSYRIMGDEIVLTLQRRAAAGAVARPEPARPSAPPAPAPTATSAPMAAAPAPTAPAPRTEASEA
ncbi:MAG: MotA/TolQ/ExbB proton channel family protein [Deltaproteobacteria bacterium]|nr:MotA/TolQ/ExbB proton channel family protein [Deltaproteobacteria bacterium]